MFKWLFGDKCDHEFHKIDTDIKYFPNYDTNRYESIAYYIMYCPKCDTEKKVNAEKYDREMEKERLKQRYGR